MKMNLQRLKELLARSEPIQDDTYLSDWVSQHFTLIMDIAKSPSGLLAYIESLEKKVEAGEELANALTSMQIGDCDCAFGDYSCHCAYDKVCDSMDNAVATYRKQVE